jgi:hypothetical protein
VRLSRIMFALALTLNGCGTQDYEKPPAFDRRPQDAGNGNPEPARPPPPQAAYSEKVPIAPRSFKPGYMWSGLTWIGVPDSTWHGLRCALKDSPDADHFKALGASVLGGAVIGIVIRSSGSYFLGKPVDPGPAHPFWQKVDIFAKTAGQGVIRGSLFTAGCEMLLAGGGLTPLRGILGQEFSALSAGLSLGLITAIASSNYVQRAVGKDPGPPKIRKGKGGTASRRRRSPNRGWLGNIEDWSRKSEIGRGIRYRFAPGIAVVGIGAGVGLLVYDNLEGKQPLPADDPDCSPSGR